MKTTWVELLTRLVRSVGCWVVAALMIWRGWTLNDPQGTESVLCCVAAFTLLVTGIAIGTGADGEPQPNADERAGRVV